MLLQLGWFLACALQFDKDAESSWHQAYSVRNASVELGRIFQRHSASGLYLSDQPGLECLFAFLFHVLFCRNVQHVVFCQIISRVSKREALCNPESVGLLLSASHRYVSAVFVHYQHPLSGSRSLDLQVAPYHCGLFLFWASVFIQLSLPLAFFFCQLDSAMRFVFDDPSLCCI